MEERTPLLLLEKGSDRWRAAVTVSAGVGKSGESSEGLRDVYYGGSEALRALYGVLDAWRSLGYKRSVMGTIVIRYGMGFLVIMGILLGSSVIKGMF